MLFGDYTQWANCMESRPGLSVISAILSSSNYLCRLQVHNFTVLQCWQHVSPGWTTLAGSVAVTNTEAILNKIYSILCMYCQGALTKPPSKIPRWMVSGYVAWPLEDAGNTVVCSFSSLHWSRAKRWGCVQAPWTLGCMEGGRRRLQALFIVSLWVSPSPVSRMNKLRN